LKYRRAASCGEGDRPPPCCAHLVQARLLVADRGCRVADSDRGTTAITVWPGELEQDPGRTLRRDPKCHGVFFLGRRAITATRSLLAGLGLRTNTSERLRHEPGRVLGAPRAIFAGAHRRACRR
jgi:hypothetical protein